jgi:hypothetical protein
MMKKIIIAAIATLASLGLVACSGNPTPTPTVTVTEQAAPQVSTQSSTDTYLEFVKEYGGPYGRVAASSTLLEMGRTVCEGLNAGLSTDDVILIMSRALVENNMDNDDGIKFAAALISGAEKYLCSSGL